MLSSRSSVSSSDGDSSSNTKAAIIAGSLVGSVCLLGLVFMWCFLWRRRNLQLKGDVEERQRELDALYPHRSETARATTEFQWPARVGEAPIRPTQFQHTQERSEKEVYLSSTATSAKPGTPASAHLKPEHHATYHISPKSVISELYKQHEQPQHELKFKFSDPSIHQPGVAELPPHEMLGLHLKCPQELPVQSPPPVMKHELEANRSAQTPGERHRFSYQI